MTRKPSRARQDIVTLADLAPKKQVIGGSERRIFGADAPMKRVQEDAMAKTTKKDLPAKKPIKGGKYGYAGNDNLTLVRAAKPAKRDLPAGKVVKGGKKAR